MGTYRITTSFASRNWQADDEEHAREQHAGAFGFDPSESIISIKLIEPCPWCDGTGIDSVPDLVTGENYLCEDCKGTGEKN